MSLKKKQTAKKEVKKQDNCTDCKVVLITLAILTLVGVLMYYLVTPSKPDIGGCYKKPYYDLYAKVKSLSDEEVYYRYLDVENTDVDTKSREFEDFNDLYSQKVDGDSCYMAEEVISIKESNKYLREKLLKLTEKE